MKPRLQIIIALGVLACAFAFMVKESWFRPGHGPGRQRLRTTMTLQEIARASSQFEIATFRWPTSAIELVTNSLHISFMDSPPPWRDGWGHEIIYLPFSTTNGHGKIISYGRDHKPGGDGYDQDIEHFFR